MEIKTIIILFVAVGFLMVVSGCTDPAPASVTPTPVVAKYKAGMLSQKVQQQSRVPLAYKIMIPIRIHIQYMMYQKCRLHNGQEMKILNQDPCPEPNRKIIHRKSRLFRSSNLLLQSYQFRFISK